ncbi:MAG TPA: HAMP domain-containing sensor histidine kinase, partial [Blastocatellia bacterium]|nr:HAMP domain-containing sensor histidine kinase [Blastocatellia bacterium]
GKASFRRFNLSNPEQVQSEGIEWPRNLEPFREMLVNRINGQEAGPPWDRAITASDSRPVIVLSQITINLPLPLLPTGNVRPHGFGPPRGTLPNGPEGLVGLDILPRRPGPPPQQRGERAGNESPPDGAGRPMQGRFFQPRQVNPEHGAPLPLMPRGRLTGYYFLELDASYLNQKWLPEIIKNNFKGDDLSNYYVAIVTGNEPQILYASDKALTPDRLKEIDSEMVLFVPQGRDLLQARNENPQPQMRREQPPPQAWRLVARHKTGSLNVVASQARLRNLAFGFGLLLLLLFGAAMLIIAAHRTRKLAVRQMEFVAGVTHELRTPLAVIQSAGFNLASGRVENEERVRRYGSVIQSEGRRLSEMVEQILSYAGIQSGRTEYTFQPTNIAEVIERALTEYDATFSESDWVIEKRIDRDLPLVMADARALESSFKNLFQNALKYAAEGKWLSVTAFQKGQEIWVIIKDRGPGIAPHDLPHVFEPFYRGRKVLASTTSGAGLGLSLLARHIKAHRGRVTVENLPEGGAAFTLRLPVMTQTEKARRADAVTTDA